jgi:predicted flap endonuclease-1-like 5' DNA nuclease
MFDRISSTRLWIAIICGIATFGILLVAHVGFLGSALFGVIVFLFLAYLFAYIFAQPAQATHAAPERAAVNPAASSPVAASAVESSSVAASPVAASPAVVTAAATFAQTDSPAVETTPVAKPAAKSAAKPAAKSAKAEPKAPAAKSTAKAAKAPVQKAAAKSAAKSDDATGTVGTAPATLSAPRGGKADDLKIIEGVGPAMEKLVNSLGFYHYDQIANWTAEEVAWVDSHMKTFRGRILRDKWQAQAKLIISEGVDAFLIRAKTNNY